MKILLSFHNVVQNLEEKMLYNGRKLSATFVTKSYTQRFSVKKNLQRGKKYREGSYHYPARNNIILHVSQLPLK